LNDDPVRNTRPFVRRQKYLVVRYGRGIEGSGTGDDIQKRPVKGFERLIKAVTQNPYFFG
jgi:hypothetical protein